LRIRNVSARPQLLKQINVGKIFARLWNEGPVSRADLARKVGISPPTVSLLINDLISDGILVEIGRGESSGGRKPVLLEINPNGPVTIAVDIHPNYYTCSTSNLLTRLDDVQRKQFSVEAHPEEIIRQIADTISERIKNIEDQGKSLLGVGVAVQGLINDSDESIIFSSTHHPNWKDIPLGEMLREYLQVPVYVENNSVTVALALINEGLARKYRNIVVFTVAEGIRAVIIADGNIYRGRSGHAGEVGHTIVDPDGRRCGCGNKGCLETMASEAALIESVRNKINRGTYSASLSLDDLSFEKIIQAFYDGDLIATSAVDELCFFLGTGLANIVNTLEPECLVLWGSLFSHAAIVNNCLKSLKEQSFQNNFEEMNLVISNMGDEAILKGAGALVIRRSLLIPYV